MWHEKWWYGRVETNDKSGGMLSWFIWGTILTSSWSNWERPKKDSMEIATDILLVAFTSSLFLNFLSHLQIPNFKIWCSPIWIMWRIHEQYSIFPVSTHPEHTHSLKTSFAPMLCNCYSLALQYVYINVLLSTLLEISVRFIRLLLLKEHFSTQPNKKIFMV